MKTSKRNVVYLSGAFSILLYFTVFAHNDLLNLDVMEVRNIVTAREMVNANNWLLPTMNGEPRIAKPPLPTWFTALPIMLTGSDENLGALRMPAGIGACLMVLFLYLLARALGCNPLISCFSAAALASSEFLIFMSKRASWDIFCHTFMLGAIWLLVSGWRKKQKTSRVFFAAGILLALSFMSKGPVSFYSMLLPFLVSYIYVFGSTQLKQQWRGNLLAIAVFISIAIIWPGYVYLHLPDSSMAVGTTEMQSWVIRQSKPLWYYLSFPVHCGIWTALFIAALLHLLKWKKQLGCSTSDKMRFFGLWTLWIVVLLTVMPKKSTHYLLPVIAPASVMIGIFMNHLTHTFADNRQSSIDRLTITVHEALVVIFSISCMVMQLYYIIDTDQSSSPGSYLPPIIFAGIAGVSWYYYRRKDIQKLYLTTLALVCFFCLFVPPVIAHMTHQRSFMTLVASRKVTRGLELPFYSSYEMNIKEVWAVGKRVESIDIRNLQAIQAPLVLFSREPLKSLLSEKQTAELRFQTTKIFVDEHSGETWHLAIIDHR